MDIPKDRPTPKARRFFLVADIVPPSPTFIEGTLYSNGQVSLEGPYHNLYGYVSIEDMIAEWEGRTPGTLEGFDCQIVWIDKESSSSGA